MAELTDQELAELRRKAHAYDSDQGRLQKTQAELDAERAARVEAEKRLAAQQQSHPAFDPKAAEVFGQDGVAILGGVLAPVLSKLETIGKKLEDRDASEAQARATRAFQDSLAMRLAENNLPGFASRILGGDLGAEWTKFVDARPSVKRAVLEGDVEAVSDVVATFIHQNRELVAGGGFSPQSIPGASPTVKAEYSDADYTRDMNALQQRLDNLTIDEKKFKEESDAIYGRWVTAQQKAERATAAYGLV